MPTLFCISFYCIGWCCFSEWLKIFQQPLFRLMCGSFESICRTFASASSFSILLQICSYVYSLVVSTTTSCVLNPVMRNISLSLNGYKRSGGLWLWVALILEYQRNVNLFRMNCIEIWRGFNQLHCRNVLFCFHPSEI